MKPTGLHGVPDFEERLAQARREELEMWEEANRQTEEMYANSGHTSNMNNQGFLVWMIFGFAVAVSIAMAMGW